MTQEIQNRKKLVAKNFASLAVGIFSVALISLDQWATIMLIIFGSIFALSGFYLRIPLNFKQEWFLKNIARDKDLAIFESIGWLAILGRLGYDLTQKDIAWLKILGILCAILAFFIFYISLCKSGKVKKNKQEVSHGQ